MSKDDKSSDARRPVLPIVALTFALVPCCLTGILGALLGIAALRRLPAPEPGATGVVADGIRRGRRLALVAVVAGIVSSVLWLFALEHYQQVMQDANERRLATLVEETLVAAQAGDAASALAVWSPGQMPGAERVTLFGRTTLERYGAFERLGIVSMTRTGTFFQPAFDVAGVFSFESASPVGSVSVAVQAVWGKTTFKIRRLVVEDAEHGDLALAPDAKDAEAGDQAP